MNYIIPTTISAFVLAGCGGGGSTLTADIDRDYASDNSIATDVLKEYSSGNAVVAFNQTELTKYPFVGVDDNTLLCFRIEYVLKIMYGNEFVASVNITRVMLVGIIFYNIFLVLNMDMAGKGKPWLAIYTLVPISLVSLLLNYFFITSK